MSKRMLTYLGNAGVDHNNMVLICAVHGIYHSSCNKAIHRFIRTVWQYFAFKEFSKRMILSRFIFWGLQFIPDLYFGAADQEGRGCYID